MPSRNAALADAVKAALNDPAAQSGFVMSFTAKRRPVPQTNLSKLGTLTVSVIAGSDLGNRIGRDVAMHDLTVFVGVEKRVQSADLTSGAANAEIDQLMLLVEQVNDFFTASTIDESLGKLVNSTIQVLSDVPALMTEQVFRGIVAVTFKLGVASD